MPPFNWGAKFDQNTDKARDPEMHQTRKGQQWYFGMALHIGMDKAGTDPSTDSFIKAMDTT